MIKLWFYDLQYRYHKYCYDKWMETFLDSGEKEALVWSLHHKEKMDNAKKRNEAYIKYLKLKHI